MDLPLKCRASYSKTDREIEQRWSNNLLCGENWHVEEDYIYVHDSFDMTYGVDVVNQEVDQVNQESDEVDQEVDEVDYEIEWAKLSKNLTSFGVKAEDPELQSENILKALPQSFDVLSNNLVELCLDNNVINVLPDDFGSNLQNLVQINLDNNELSELGSSFCLMKNLKECVLSQNKLKFLPANFDKLTNLTHLRLDHNELNHLPSSLFECTELSILDLIGNRFPAFPSRLTELPKLNCLGIDIHLSNMPVVMKFHFSEDTVLKLHEAILRGLEYWQRHPSSIRILRESCNADFIDDLLWKKESMLQKSRCVDEKLDRHDADRENISENSEDEWGNTLVPVTCNFLKFRAKIAKELAFSERYHMPRMPDKPVPVPLFHKNPLMHKGAPFAYKHLAVKKWRRFRLIKHQ